MYKRKNEDRQFRRKRSSWVKTDFQNVRNLTQNFRNVVPLTKNTFSNSKHHISLVSETHSTSAIGISLTQNIRSQENSRNFESSDGAQRFGMQLDSLHINNEELSYWPESSDDEDAAEEKLNLEELLRNWAISFNITHAALKNLLVILKQFHDLPSDPRTILGTSKIVNATEKLGDGEYCHYGLKHQIQNEIKKAFQETFFKKLAESIEEENNRLLKKIVFSECRPANEQDLPQDIPQLPLNSVSAVAELETWLSVEGNKQCLVNYLSIIGGKDIHDATRKIMAKIIGRELAVQYNWAGRGEKLPFSQLKLKDIVLGAVLKTSEEKEFSFTRISQDIKDWLKSAKYRTKSLAMNTAE